MKNNKIAKITILTLMSGASILGTSASFVNPSRYLASVNENPNGYSVNNQRVKSITKKEALTLVYSDGLNGGGNSKAQGQLQMLTAAELFNNPKVQKLLNDPSKKGAAAKEVQNLLNAAKELDKIRSNPSSYDSTRVKILADTINVSGKILGVVGDLAVGGPLGAGAKAVAVVSKAKNLSSGAQTILSGTVDKSVGLSIGWAVGKMASAGENAVKNSEMAYSDRVKKLSEVQSGLDSQLKTIAPTGGQMLANISLGAQGPLAQELLNNYIAPQTFGIDPNQEPGQIIAANKDAFVWAQLAGLKINESGQIEASSEQLAELSKKIVAETNKNVKNLIDAQTKKVAGILEEQKTAEENRRKDEANRILENQKAELAEKTLATTVNTSLMILNLIDPKAAAKITPVVQSAMAIRSALKAFSSNLELNKFNASALLTGDLIGIGLNLIGAFMNTGPTADEMILEGIQNLSKQISELSQQMHDRFDRIDQSLSNISLQLSQMMMQVSEISEDVLRVNIKMNEAIDRLSNIQDSVDDLKYQMNSVDHNLYQGIQILRKGIAREALADCDRFNKGGNNLRGDDRINMAIHCVTRATHSYMGYHGDEEKNSSKDWNSEEFKSLAGQLDSDPSVLNNYFATMLQFGGFNFFSNVYLRPDGAGGVRLTLWNSLKDLSAQATNEAYGKKLKNSDFSDLAEWNGEFSDLQNPLNIQFWATASEAVNQIAQQSPDVAHNLPLGSVATLVAEGEKFERFYKTLSKPATQAAEDIERKKKLWLNVVNWAKGSLNGFEAELRNFAKKYESENSLAGFKTELPQNQQPRAITGLDGPVGYCADAIYAPFTGWNHSGGTKYGARGNIAINFKSEWADFLPAEVIRARDLGLVNLEVCIHTMGFEGFDPGVNSHLGLPVNLSSLSKLVKKKKSEEWQSGFIFKDIVRDSAIPNPNTAIGPVEFNVPVFSKLKHPREIGISDDYPRKLEVTYKTYGRAFVGFDLKIKPALGKENKVTTGTMRFYVKENQVHPMVKNIIVMNSDRVMVKENTASRGRGGIADYEGEPDNSRYRIDYNLSVEESRMEPLKYTEANLQVLFNRPRFVFTLDGGWAGADDLNKNGLDVKLASDIEKKLESDRNRFLDKLATTISQGSENLGQAYYRAEFANLALKHLMDSGFSRSLMSDDQVRQAFFGASALQRPSQLLGNVISGKDITEHQKERLTFFDNIRDASSSVGKLNPETLKNFEILEYKIQSHYSGDSQVQGEVPLKIAEELDQLRALRDYIEEVSADKIDLQMAMTEINKAVEAKARELGL